jgi:hypothetical protein
LNAIRYLLSIDDRSHFAADVSLQPKEKARTALLRRIEPR